MSTYLVAWAIVPDDYQSASVTTDKGVKVTYTYMEYFNLKKKTITSNLR